MVGEAGPSCQSPPPIARSASVACRTTPYCRAHAGRGIWPPRIRGPGTTARSKCVRPVAARRAPRKTRTLEGACSAVVRLQACEPVCGYPSSSTWTPLLASRTPLCAQDVETCRRWKQRQKKARRRNVISSLLRLAPRLGHRSHERIVATLERTLGKLVEVGLGSVVLGRNLVLFACFLGLVAVH